MNLEISIGDTKTSVQKKVVDLSDVKSLSADHIEVLGEEYYKRSYLTIMMQREYRRGLVEGHQVHIASVEKCSHCIVLLN